MNSKTKEKLNIKSVYDGGSGDSSNDSRVNRNEYRQHLIDHYRTLDGNSNESGDDLIRRYGEPYYTGFYSRVTGLYYYV